MKKIVFVIAVLFVIVSVFSGCASDKIDYENLSEGVNPSAEANNGIGVDSNTDSITLKTAIQLACNYVGCSVEDISFTYDGATEIEGMSCDGYTAFGEKVNFSFALNSETGTLFVDGGDGYTRVRTSN